LAPLCISCTQTEKANQASDATIKSENASKAASIASKAASNATEEAANATKAAAIAAANASNAITKVTNRLIGAENTKERPSSIQPNWKTKRD
jgi:hypothetical protein